MGKRLVTASSLCFANKASSFESWKLKLDKSKLEIRYAVLGMHVIKS